VGCEANKRFPEFFFFCSFLVYFWGTTFSLQKKREAACFYLTVDENIVWFVLPWDQIYVAQTMQLIKKKH